MSLHVHNGIWKILRGNKSSLFKFTSFKHLTLSPWIKYQLMWIIYEQSPEFVGTIDNPDTITHF